MSAVGRARRPAGPTGTVLVAHPGAQLYGSDRMLIESVTGLVDAGWRVVVTVPADGPLVEQVRARGATVELCPTPVLRKSLLGPAGALRVAGHGLGALRPGLRLLRRCRPDALYVNTVTIPMWLVLARLCRVPSVCHVHEGEPTVAPVVRRALTLPLVLANRLIVISRHCAALLVDDWPGLRPRIELVYNGVRGPDAPPPPRPALTPPVRLLFLGRLSVRKGVQDAVDALAVLRGRGVDVTLDLVGDTFTDHDWLGDDLARRAREAGTTDALRFHGFDGDVWPHLARADILVVPSRLEPFGLVVVEGARAARPVVATRVGGMVEAAVASRAAVVAEPRSPDALADAVESVIARWGDYRVWAVEDASAAADRFSMERYRSAIGAAVAVTAGSRPRRRQDSSAP